MSRTSSVRWVRDDEGEESITGDEHRSKADLSVMRRIEPERVDGMGIEKVGKD